MFFNNYLTQNLKLPFSKVWSRLRVGGHWTGGRRHPGNPWRRCFTVLEHFWKHSCLVTVVSLRQVGSVWTGTQRTNVLGGGRLVNGIYDIHNNNNCCYHCHYHYWVSWPIDATTTLRAVGTLGTTGRTCATSSPAEDSWETGWRLLPWQSWSSHHHFAYCDDKVWVVFLRDMWHSLGQVHWKWVKVAGQD